MRAATHQPVEVVVLDLAAEDAAERVLEHRVQRVDVDVGVGQRATACRSRACQIGGCSGGDTRCGRSSSTLRPMRSSIGRLSDSVTGAPRWKSLKRSVPAPASSGR